VIPKKLRIIWEIISSCIDGIFVYIGCYFVLSGWLGHTPQAIEFARNYFGIIGEWLVTNSPLWLPIPAPIIVTWELSNYRIQKLKEKKEK